MVWQSEPVFLATNAGMRLRGDRAQTISNEPERDRDFHLITARSQAFPVRWSTGSQDESAPEQERVIRKAAWQSFEKLMFNQK
jgi:hypothetical protein